MYRFKAFLSFLCHVRSLGLPELSLSEKNQQEFFGGNNFRVFTRIGMIFYVFVSYLVVAFCVFMSD